MLEQIRQQIRALLDQRATRQAELDGYAERGETLEGDDAAAFEAARTELRSIDEQIDGLRAREAELADDERRRSAADELRRQLAETPAGPVTPEPGTTVVRVGREQLTYRQGGEHSFVSDAYAAQFGGSAPAAERIARHRAEMDVELRAVGTSAFTNGLVIPQYLVDEFAPLARAGRPLANVLRRVELPADGMTVNVPRLTTGTATAVQATENTAVQNTDAAATLLTVNVNTIAGQQVVSRQAVERGTGIDSILLGDLVADYHTRLDGQLISGSGASGQHLGVLNVAGINAVTYTDASPTLPELYPKLADSSQRIASSRYVGSSAQIFAMHPRRWAFMQAALDSTNRPLITPRTDGPFNVMGVGEFTAADGFVGDIGGVPVLIDANIPVNLGGGTNEDRVLTLVPMDHVLYEQPGHPLMLRFEQTAGANLSITLVVYGYSAYAAGRYPAGISVISGTGLATPTF